MMLNHPALRQQIITYIGNKRKLLPFIRSGIEAILEEEGLAGDGSSRLGNGNTPPLRFLDAFAGSGVVSRMARLMGFEVRANDLELYAAPLLTPFLRIQPDEVEGVFAPVAESLGLSTDPVSEPATQGELWAELPEAAAGTGRDAPSYRRVLAYLNSLVEPEDGGNAYFARHYAPAQTAAADPDRERLFYTRENALRIDAILEALRGAPFGEGPARDTILASLLHEMSVHVNTSGVMKGYHRGWGGRGGDALGRIMAPITLKPLPFITGPRGSVSTLPAEELFSTGELPEQDIIYADPPYNIHQYGANYHLLNTAVLGDRYDPGPVIHGSRAGIRRDHNRSPFCRSTPDTNTGLRECEAAFDRFVRQLRGRFLLVSYNTDGLIPPERMAGILSRGGRNRVTATVREHVKFKGGKNTQSSRRTRELLYRVDLHRPAVAGELDGLQALLAREERLGRLRDSYIDPRKLSWHCEVETGGDRIFRRGDGVPLLRLGGDLRLREVYPAGREESVLGVLEPARLEKPALMERYLEERMVSEAIDLLRSFKIRKYRQELLGFAERINEIADPRQAQRLHGLLESYGVSLARKS